MAIATPTDNQSLGAPRPADISLLPTHPESWAQYDYEQLFQLSRAQVEGLQLAAMQHRFAQLRDGIDALAKLANRQGVKEIGSISEALPLFFDHRVYKSYPLTLIETRDFPKLTSWLNRLTLHDLKTVDLRGLKTLDDWLSRLDSFGMIIGHSTGTTGKLSFIPRSKVEWPAWSRAFNDTSRAATGVDPLKDFVPTFFPGYRGGHHMALKMLSLFNIPAAGGPEHYHTLYQSKVSSDLMSLAADCRRPRTKARWRNSGSILCSWESAMR